MLLCADTLASTHAIAAALAGLARAGDVIVLAGEMGAGKTAFAQGFGRALGITEPITSPTFTLVHSYPVPGSKLTLHHADLYRLDSTSDVDDLALHELAEDDGIVLIEWGDVAASTLGDHLEVRLRPVDVDDDGDDDDDVEEAVAGDPGAADAASDETEFGLDERRLIDLEATGRSWAGRWDRVVVAVESYRC
jgi:tRNA threonylcarbamoyladenosine biosynthesis protein TsaE